MALKPVMDPKPHPKQFHASLRFVLCESTNIRPCRPNNGVDPNYRKSVKNKLRAIQLYTKVHLNKRSFKNRFKNVFCTQRKIGLNK